MERPTDAYKRTHNVRLATRDKLFGGQVSRLQVAELIAAAVTNPEAAENKVSRPLCCWFAESEDFIRTVSLGCCRFLGALLGGHSWGVVVLG